MLLWQSVWDNQTNLGMWNVIFSSTKFHYSLCVCVTGPCRYNAVNFLPNPHDRHPISRPMWGVCCDSKIWFTVCHCYYSDVCNIVINSTALWRRFTVLHMASISVVAHDEQINKNVWLTTEAVYTASKWNWRRNKGIPGSYRPVFFGER